MPLCYCFRCKAMREMADAVQYTMRDGKSGLRGRCAQCGGRLSRRGTLPQSPAQDQGGGPGPPP